MRKIVQGRKILSRKVGLIFVSVLFLVQSGWSVLLLPPFHTHSTARLVSIVSPHQKHRAHQAHYHQVMLHRDGSLVWYSVYPEAYQVEISSRERGRKEISQQLPSLISHGGERFVKVGSYSFLCLPVRFAFFSSAQSVWIKTVSDRCFPAGYLFPIDHPPKNLFHPSSTV